VRIGITGSHGVGKTTLAQALSSALNLPLIQEQARVVAKELGINSLDEIKNDKFRFREYQCLVPAYQIDTERLNPAGFVSDRTTIDCAAYWLKWHAHNWPSKLNNNYYNICMVNVKYYDLIVYVPAESSWPADDGFRDTDRSCQVEVDFYIRCLLAEADPANWIAVEGSPDDMVKQVLSRLSDSSTMRLGCAEHTGGLYREQLVRSLREISGLMICEVNDLNQLATTKKALDMACKKLAERILCCPAVYYDGTIQLTKCKTADCDCHTKWDCWRDYFIQQATGN
jgi:nicotinamide riboside kinase